MATDVTWEDILNDHETTSDVLMYGMGNNAQRFSSLNQINTETVRHLRPAWAFSFGDEKQRGQETQAIVHHGTIYIIGSYSRMWALDAKTGERKWKFEARLPDDIRPCCDVINRGAAIYGDKVYFGALDASVYALNKETGKVEWREKFADHKVGYTMTSAHHHQGPGIWQGDADPRFLGRRIRRHQLPLRPRPGHGRGTVDATLR